MNVKELNESISKIAVDAETKQGLLEVINITNASNMETILNELQIINLNFKSELKEMRSDFKSELKAIREKSDSEFKEIRSDFKSELKAIREKSDSEFKEIRSDFKSELRAIREKSDSEFKIMYSELKRIESKNDTKTTMIMSFIGLLTAIMIASKFIH